MGAMFTGAARFNQPLASWDVSSVTDISYMFRDSSFNQPLNDWDTSRVTSLGFIFWNAPFNQNLGNWITDIDSTMIRESNIPGVVGTVSLPTPALRNNNNVAVTYGIGAGDDSGFFNMTGNKLFMTGHTTKEVYSVNITSTFSSLFTPGGFATRNYHVYDISVSDNSLPDVDAGERATVTEGYELQLRGTATDDDTNDVLSYNWYDNHTSLILNDAKTLTPSFIAPSVSMDTTIEFTLSVNDGTGTAEDTVLVIVADDGRNLGDDFVTVWETKTDNDAILIPVGDSASTYAIDWGDGTMNRGVTGSVAHTYATAGSHTVRIFDGFDRIYLGGNGTNAAKLKSIGQWGNASWASMSGAFEGAENMAYNAADVPDLSRVTNMSGMFRFTSFNGDIDSWNVSQVTDMSGIFSAATTFDQPLNSWNVSQVTDMSDMFHGATDFDQPLNSWNVSQVTDMSGMFGSTIAFDSSP